MNIGRVSGTPSRTGSTVIEASASSIRLLALVNWYTAARSQAPSAYPLGVFADAVRLWDRVCEREFHSTQKVTPRLLGVRKTRSEAFWTL